MRSLEKSLLKEILDHNYPSINCKWQESQARTSLICAQALFMNYQLFGLNQYLVLQRYSPYQSAVRFQKHFILKCPLPGIHNHHFASCSHLNLTLNIFYFKLIYSKSIIINRVRNMKSKGVELESIKQPEKVKVLILVENKTSLKQFYFIKNYSNLIKIDLSYNKLSAFPAGFNFIVFDKLRTLFLHYNKFSGLKNILPVTDCPNLLYLTLFGNPLEQAKARHFVINEIPSLMLLDDKIVRLQQRYPEVSFHQTSFPALNFPLIPQITGENSQMYLENVIQQLHVVRSYYLLANPIIRIQRWWKHLCRIKHRRWRMPVVSQQVSNNFYSTKQQTNGWDRLITERYQILDSPQTKILSLFTQNGQFWTWFRQSFIKHKIYLSRNYCLLNNIKFEQIKHFMTFKTFLNVDNQKLAGKKHLNFFLKYHNYIIVKKVKGKVKKYDICEEYKIIYKKLSLKQGQGLQNKLNKRQQIINKQWQNYKWYVKPVLNETELFTIIKTQYQTYIRNYIRNTENQPFPVFIEKLNERAMASTTIQRYWKGYRVRKYINAYRTIRQISSARRIQKWVRSLRFFHRYKFLLLSSEYLRKQKHSKQIILQKSQLKAIQQYCTYKQRFGHLFIIKFQNNTFNIQKINEEEQHLQKEPTITFYSERKPYLHYFNLDFQIATNPQIGKIQPATATSNILQILFKGVQQLHQYTDLKGNKMIKLTYRSTQETLNRKFILALKTYRMLNHQFIGSATIHNVASPITNIIEEFNSNWLVSLSYKSEKEESILSSKKSLNKSLDHQLHQNPKDIILQGDTYYFKIKLYIVITDHSCALIARSPNYSTPALHIDQQKLQSLNTSSNNLKKSKLHSNRYENEISYPQKHVKISRNVMSLDNLQSISSIRRQSLNLPKILNTDQSHTYLTGSISHQNSQANISTIQRRVSENKYEELSLSKQNKIKQIKLSHREKIAQIFCRKQKQITNLRKSIKNHKEEIAKSISYARQSLEQEKIRKHDQIRNHLKNISSTFESQFLKKGIKNIRLNLREYEKTRSYRQKEKSEIKFSKITKQIYEPDIKQFSIHFTEGDNESNKYNYDSTSIQKSRVQHNLKDKHKKQMVIENCKQMINPDNVDASEKDVQPQQFEQIRNSKHSDNMEEHRKLKKKRFVHSVFPEQFYPIRQSKQIQFQLPKINKK